MAILVETVMVWDSKSNKHQLPVLILFIIHVIPTDCSSSMSINDRKCIVIIMFFNIVCEGLSTKGKVVWSMFQSENIFPGTGILTMIYNTKDLYGSMHIYIEILRCPPKKLIFLASLYSEFILSVFRSTKIHWLL